MGSCIMPAYLVQKLNVGNARQTPHTFLRPVIGGRQLAGGKIAISLRNIETQLTQINVT